MAQLQTGGRVAACALILGFALPAASAKAWNDEGHEVVALIADHFLEPAVRQKVHAMLALDTDGLIAHNIANEATWLDKYGESDRGTTKERYNQTRQWHFVNIEVDQPDIDAACFGHPAIPAGTPASRGPADDCIVDKINQFATELANPDTSQEERLNALKFLLHLVGDLHQPLHASDHHDAGGTQVGVRAAGFRPGNLHYYWDTEFVEELGDDPKQVAADLISGIDQSGSVAAMATGTPTDWAMESFQLSKDHAYGNLGKPNASGTYRLSPAYITDAIETVRVQLARAGVRLATVLNKALAAGS